METAVLAERLAALDSDGEGGCEPADLAELVAITQRLNTMIAVATDGFDATGQLTSDGYRSPAGFLARDGGRLGRGSARRFLACGRVLDQFPVLARAAAAGQITFDHVAAFARLLPASASEHRRVCLARDEAWLVAAAKTESATDFSKRCVSWRHEIDPDDHLSERLGAEDHGMTVNELDVGSSELTLRGETAEIEQIRAMIKQLADEAWRARRDRRPEDDSPPSDGDPTPELALSSDRHHPIRGRLQLEAAVKLAGLTGGSAGSSSPAKPLVVVVMDWDTFNLEAERFATGTADSADVFAPEFRSERIDGHPIPPAQAFLLALQGEVQRCVIGVDSLKVDLGRQQRLFNAAGRRAVRVRDRTCTHPACDLPATWADIDHILDWQFHGPTNTANGQALCRFHHIQKHQRSGGNPGGGTERAA